MKLNCFKNKSSIYYSPPHQTAVTVHNLHLYWLSKFLKDKIVFFYICRTVHHHSINKNDQRDAACSIRLYYACNSTITGIIKTIVLQ